MRHPSANSLLRLHPRLLFHTNDSQLQIVYPPHTTHIFHPLNEELGELEVEEALPEGEFTDCCTFILIDTVPRTRI